MPKFAEMSGLVHVRHAAGILVVVALVSCRNGNIRLIEPPETAPHATPQCLDSDSPDYYFAPDQINATRDDRFIRQEWFRTYLRVAQAHSLSCGDEKEAYRLLWMPSFRKARIITLQHANRQWLLETIDFGGDLLQNRRIDSPPLPKASRQLSTAEVERVRIELISSNFWGAPQFRHDPQVNDGVAVAIEGRSGERYRVLSRLNSHDDLTHITCVFFQLGRLSIPEMLECPTPVDTPHD